MDTGLILDIREGDFVMVGTVKVTIKKVRPVRKSVKLIFSGDDDVKILRGKHFDVREDEYRETDYALEG